MSQEVLVRKLTLSSDRCRVILPITAETEDDIFRQASDYVQLGADLIEWRADYYCDMLREEAVLSCLHTLRQLLGETPLLVTWRTKSEGGQRPATPEAYAAFYRLVCKSGCADLLDVELFTEPTTLYSIIACAHENGCKVICSSHDFTRTPTPEEMLARLCRMQQLGADIAKLAVMPRSEADVAALLAVTAEMKLHHPATPVITMSMGSLGQISRIAAAKMGSCATFASAGTASAPGQLDYAAVREMLRLLDV